MVVNEQALAYDGFDFLKLDNFMMDKHRETRDRVRAFVRDSVLPNINPYWDRAEFPRDIVMQMRDLDIIGGIIRRKRRRA